MAAAEMLATDIDLEMEEIVESSTSNIDEYEGEMQVFVQQHLLSLLQPVNATLQDLQEQIHRLRRDFLARHVSIDESLDRVARHEKSLNTLSTDLSTVSQRANRTHTELSQMIEITGKATRERVEATCARIDEQLQDVVSRTSCLETWKSEAAGEDHAGEDDGHIGQLQSGVAEVSERVKQMENDMAEMQRTCEGLHHCNLGLSNRLEQAKMKLDDASKDLYKVVHTTTHHIEESKLTHATNIKKVQHLEERLVVSCFDIENHSSRLVKVEGEVKNVWGQVTAVQSIVQADERKQESIKEDMIELQKLDTRSAITKLSQVVDSLDSRIIAISEGASPMVKSELSKLNEGAEKAARSIAEQVVDIRKWDGYSQRVDRRLKKIEELQVDHGTRHDRLLARANTSVTEVQDLAAFVTATEGKMDGWQEEIQKVNARIYRCEKGIESHGPTFTSLFDGLAATNEKIARNSNRLNLAHGYLKGMTKGISEAQKRSGDGLEGLLPADRLKTEEICLPDLPGSPHRRPATSMT